MLKPVDEALVNLQDRVRQDFSWSEAGDIESANAMSRILAESKPFGVEQWAVKKINQNLDVLTKRLTEAEIVVLVGAAATEEQVEFAVKQNYTIIAADGAVGAVRDRDKIAAIVSDFDGEDYLDVAAKEGHLIIGHVHGDNQDKWHTCLKKWSGYLQKPEMIFTHQTNSSFDYLFNPGGFTDGDRALAIILSLGIPREKIQFVGYEMTPSDRWSTLHDLDKKRKKLEWMLECFRLCGVEDKIIV